MLNLKWQNKLALIESGSYKPGLTSTEMSHCHELMRVVIVMLSQIKKYAEADLLTLKERAEKYCGKFYLEHSFTFIILN